MARTSYFSNRAPGGAVSILSADVSTGGRYWVDSVNGADTNSGMSPDTALATVDAAIGKCTANKGDIIYVTPTHAETVSTAVVLFDLDVAGVSIIGLGQGDQRPTFTFTHADATVVIGASSCRLSNLRFISNVEDHATALAIEAAAVGATVEHCYFADTSTGADCLVVIAVEADADRLTITDNHFNMVIGGEATECIALAGGCDRSLIARNIAYGDWKTGGWLECSTAASLGLIVVDNAVTNAETGAGLCYNGHAGNTGMIARNIFNGSKDGTEPIATVTAMHVNENYMTDLPAASGIISATVTTWP